MTYLRHRSQYDGSPRQNEACTMASLANGARVATAGKIDRTAAQITALLTKAEEQNPGPGWSLADADKAMGKLGVPFDIGTGGWAGVVAAHDKGYAVILQGISRVFTKGCSGAFDGAHCVCLYPESHSDGKRWMLGDPICTDARWEAITLLRSYAELFNPAVSFGVFPTPIKTYTQAEYDAAVKTAKQTGVSEGTEAEQLRLGRLLGIID